MHKEIDKVRQVKLVSVILGFHCGNVRCDTVKSGRWLTAFSNYLLAVFISRLADSGNGCLRDGDDVSENRAVTIL